jgi:hypothetical protein
VGNVKDFENKGEKFMKMLTNGLAIAALLLLCLAATWTPAAAQSETLYAWTLVNNSRYDITEIHLVKSGARDWGPDKMGTCNMESGGKCTFRRPVGEYDIRVMVSAKNDDYICDWRKVKFTATSTMRIVPNLNGPNCKVRE